MSEKKGIDSLRVSVISDCQKGSDCFNPNGCEYDHSEIKCTHKYCDKYKWILDRANMYSEKLGIPFDEVLKSWEECRSYWYMNYYQESNQPDIASDDVTLFEDWITILEERFGKNKKHWAFKCPACGHIQTMGDFESIGFDPGNAHCNCIGRFKEGTGCNYTLGGFLTLSNNKVVRGAKVYSVFEIAEAP